MPRLFKALVLTVFMALMPLSFGHAVVVSASERSAGKADAPITVDEYVSLTCSHCADFYNNVLPQLEKDYVETGKVRFIMHDYPLDGVSLKASALARCMPKEQILPFVKILFKNQMSWAASPDAEKILVQYAMLGGLDEAKAKACFNDTKMHETIVAERTEATNKFHIEATPTFVINKGVEVLRGAQPVSSFASTFDKLLAPKK